MQQPPKPPSPPVANPMATTEPDITYATRFGHPQPVAPPRPDIPESLRSPGDRKYTPPNKLPVVGRATPKTLISYIDLDTLGEDPTHIPTQKDFAEVWDTLQAEEKRTVKALFAGDSTVTFREALAKSFGIPLSKMNKELPYHAIMKRLASRRVMKAFYYGTVGRMSSDAAKKKFVKEVLGKLTMSDMTRQVVEDIVMTDADHLKELAAKLRTKDGDGKRDILNTLIAYGMQTKILEHSIKDDNGKVTAPTIYGLADPKMAFSSLQELNRMDNEYGDDDKATSSIEGQAARIRRLANQVDKESAKRAKQLGGIARTITAKELIAADVY